MVITSKMLLCYLACCYCGQVKCLWLLKGPLFNIWFLLAGPRVQFGLILGIHTQHEASRSVKISAFVICPAVMSGSSFGWFVWGPFLCKLQSVLIYPLRLLVFALVSCLIKPLFFYDVFYSLSWLNRNLASGNKFWDKVLRFMKITARPFQFKECPGIGLYTPFRVCCVIPWHWFGHTYVISGQTTYHEKIVLTNARIIGITFCRAWTVFKGYQQTTLGQ